MVRDYAKPPSSPRSSNRFLMRWLLIVVAVAIIALIVVLVYYFKHGRVSAPPKQQLNVAAVATTQTTLQPPLVAHQNKKVQFDFYQLLPQIKMEVIKSSQTQQLPPKFDYFLQVAALQNRADAQHFTGILQKLGYQARVTKFVDGSRQLWYRVLLGPYSSRQDATKARQQLESRKIRSIMLKS